MYNCAKSTSTAFDGFALICTHTCCVLSEWALFLSKLFWSSFPFPSDSQVKLYTDFPIK